MKGLGKAALIFLAPVLVLALTIGARADGTEAMEELQRAAGEYAPEEGQEGGTDLNAGLGALAEKAQAQLGGVVRRGVKSGVILLAVVLFCALAEGLSEVGGRSRMGVEMVGALAVWGVAVGDVNSLMGLGREAIEAMKGFTAVLLPTMAAAASAAGTPTSAVARQMATVLFSDLLMMLISNILIPLTYAYVAAAAINAAVGNNALKRLAKSMKGVVTGTLTAVMVAFVGYLSVSGVVTGSADAISVKTAKMAISGMVPVVGGVLSDAAETVLAGAGALKNTIGVFGMLVILGICLTPFLQMGAHYLVYKLAAALSGVVSDGPTVELIDQVGGAFGLILGMTGSCALLLLVSILSCLNAAGVT